MDQQDTRHKRRKKRKSGIGKIVFIVALAVVLIAAGALLYGHYAPTTEHISLEEVFLISQPDEAAVILNGQYDYIVEGHTIDAITSDGIPYISLSYLKSNLDDGYVFDSDGGILRYVTDSNVISVGLGVSTYVVGQEETEFTETILIPRYENIYVNMGFVSMFTDLNFLLLNDPSRIVIETAGTEKTVGTLKKDTAVRRAGGPKSLILEDAIAGESVWVLENYGRWSKVLTEAGVIGCVENNTIEGQTKVTVEPNLPERVFTHNLMDEKIIMSWHQVTNAAANSTLAGALDRAQGLNVISPTWYRISDNDGNVSGIASMDYVNTCHSRGVKVWAMISNFEVEGVDSTLVLNRVASRDNLVNSLVNRAVADGVDGINIDFEALSIYAKDGFIEFIRELSLQCKANNLVLSVVNYKPEAHTQFYNRSEQAKYADYVMVIGYDEYHNDSAEAGSNSSYPFVEAGVRDTLLEVPPEQLLLGLAFYTRIWSQDAAGLTNRAVGMAEAARQVNEAGAERVWLDREQQYYATYEKEEKLYQVWLEEEQSLAAKLNVAKENNLAGVAFWKIGFENTSVWPVINGYIN